MLDDNVKMVSTIELPSKLVNAKEDSITAMFAHNNTFTIILKNKKSWELISIEIPKFLPDGKLFYIYFISLLLYCYK